MSGSTASDVLATLETPKPQGLGAASRWLTIATVLGFVIPVCAYLWFIQRYGVNVIWRDQWSDVNLAGQIHQGKLSLGALWAPHNQNRLLFPNLLVAVLVHTTRLNLFVEMYLSALILLAAIALFIWTHKRRSPSTAWIFYCPVAILLLSFVQYENTLSGFQVCWYFVLLALAGALFFLDSPRFGWFPLTCAVLAAVVGSYSAIQGLYIWPVGLLLLFQRRRPVRYGVAWVAAGIITTAVFFYHLGGSSFGESPGSISSALAHPILTAKFFFLAIGDVVGAWLPWQLPGRAPTASTSVSWAALLLGVLIFAIAAWVLVMYLRRDEDGPSPIGVALIGFGFLFALSIATGRSTLIGLWYAGTSRYTTFDLLFLVGIYLTLLGHTPGVRAKDPLTSHTDAPTGHRVPGLLTLARKVQREDGSLAVVVRGSLAIIFCVQLILGLLSGLAGGRSTHLVGLATEDVIVNAKVAPDSVIELTYFGPDVAFARRMALLAVKLRLTFLASSAGSRAYMREGLDVGVWEGGTTSPVMPWRGLRDGQVVAIDAQHFSARSDGPLTVSECNANALSDPNACERGRTVTVLPGRDGSIHARFTVTTGPVGDGTCTVGQVCYIEVSSPRHPSLQSFAEISF